MPDWAIWIWIGPLTALVLAFWLRPAYLSILGFTAFAGFIVAVETTDRLYPDCLDNGCPRGEHILSVLSGTLFLLAGALLLLALLKHILRTSSDFSATRQVARVVAGLIAAGLLVFAALVGLEGVNLLTSGADPEGDARFVGRLLALSAVPVGIVALGVLLLAIRPRIGDRVFRGRH